jgi:hypothetical protein
MITKILHQAWNERRYNSLIFGVLLLTTIFIWMISDPIYVIFATKAIPDNYEKRDRYCVRLDFDYSEMLKEENNLALYNQYCNIIHAIKSLPEVESSMDTYMSLGAFNSTMHCSDRLYYDEEKKDSFVYVWTYRYIWEGDQNMFATLGLKDANTGKTLTVPENIKMKNDIFISRHAAMKLFGTTEVIVRKHTDPHTKYVIRGVYDDFQLDTYVEPLPSMIELEAPDLYGIMGHSSKRIVKLAEGTDIDHFTRKVEGVVSEIDKENNFQVKVLTLDELQEDTHIEKEARYTINQKIILNSFALACIFLCMLGTFWTRMDNRRSDIGIMCSMGASRSRVVKQYITEALILLTLAFATAMPIVLHFVVTEGFAQPGVCDFDKENFTPNPEYGMNNFYIHFAWVTAITYVAMLLITIIGTWIPVYRATRIQPADALRDE